MSCGCCGSALLLAHGGLAVLLILGGVPGCDGPGKEAEDDDSVLRIGLIAPFSGSNAAGVAAAPMAVELAAFDLNAAGGVLGRRIELIKFDQETISDSIEDAMEVFDRGLRIVIHASSGAAPDLALSQVAEQRGSLLYETGYHLVDDRYWPATDLMFRDGFSPALLEASYRVTIADWVRPMVVFLCPSGNGQCALYEEMIAATGLAVHVVETDDTVWSSPQSVDFTPYVREMLDVVQDGPWMLAAVAGTVTHVHLLLRMADLAAPAQYPMILAEEEFVGSRDFLDLVPRSLLVNTVAVVRAPLYGTGAGEAFARRFQEVFGQEATSLAARAHTALYLIALAIEAAQSLEPTEIAAQLGPVSRDGIPVAAADFALARELLQRGEDIDFTGANGPADLDVHGTLGALLATRWNLDATAAEARWMPADTIFLCSDRDRTGSPTCTPHVEPTPLR